MALHSLLRQLIIARVSLEPLRTHAMLLTYEKIVLYVLPAKTADVSKLSVDEDKFHSSVTQP